MTDERIKNHRKTAAFYGFTDTALTDDELSLIYNAGLDESDAYQIECDLQSGAIETASEAIKYYTQQECED